MKKNKTKNLDIDLVIKKYLIEREEEILDDSPIDDSYGFSHETKESITGIIRSLNHSIDILNVIKTRESDVVIETDVYSDVYLETLVNDLEFVVERLVFIKGL